MSVTESSVSLRECLSEACFTYFGSKDGVYRGAQLIARVSSLFPQASALEVCYDHNVACADSLAFLTDFPGILCGKHDIGKIANSAVRGITYVAVAILDSLSVVMIINATGIADVGSLGQIKLAPILQGSYIWILAVSCYDQMGKLRDGDPRIKREAVFKVAAYASSIINQSAPLLGYSNQPVKITLGVVSASLNIAAGIACTDAMANWFDS